MKPSLLEFLFLLDKFQIFDITRSTRHQKGQQKYFPLSLKKNEPLSFLLYIKIPFTLFNEKVICFKCYYRQRHIRHCMLSNTDQSTYVRFRGFPPGNWVRGLRGMSQLDLWIIGFECQFHAAIQQIFISRIYSVIIACFVVLSLMDLMNK